MTVVDQHGDRADDVLAYLHALGDDKIQTSHRKYQCLGFFGFAARTGARYKFVSLSPGLPARLNTRAP